MNMGARALKGLVKKEAVDCCCLVFCSSVRAGNKGFSKEYLVLYNY